MPLPERLGKYSIVEVLGKGAMGVVYKAFDPHIRRTVALKVIRKEIIDDDQSATLIARFKNEAQAAGRLTHPGIVAVYEYGEDEAVAYIAMEYVQGKGLREYFQRGTRFGLGDVVSIMTQLLDGLGYAHEQGVIHRDIKPANIIIMGNGKLKVADFGIAHLDSSKLTHLGTVMGTPGYMAPEQYSGAAVDRRADIFSSGVVLYQLLTGVKPFTGTTEPSRTRAATSRMSTRPRSHPSSRRWRSTRWWPRHWRRNPGSASAGRRSCAARSWMPILRR
jgi:serine/threonine-protein kinase